MMNNKRQIATTGEPKPKTSSLQPPASSLWPILILALGALAFMAEMSEAAAGRFAERARRALYANQPAEALRHTKTALACAPYRAGVSYTQLVALKRMNHWRELDRRARSAVAWHPERAAVLKLAGEAAMRTGDPGTAAAANLWEAFALDSTPEESPSALWRMALRASLAAGDATDPHVRAAAMRVAMLVENDTRLTPAARRDSLLEAADAMEQAGAPLTAQSLRERANNH